MNWNIFNCLRNNRKSMKNVFASFAALSVCLVIVSPAQAQFDKTFTTKYTTVHYARDKDLDEFIWKLGGQRMEFMNDRALASNRIDRVVNRVQSILDMWPNSLHLDIYLHREVLEHNKVAFYKKSTDSLHIAVDYASDGVLAHEIVHAVIDQYFPVQPPSKMQEILAQYVDRHLWSDY